jgi:hypothetical protein
MKFQEEIAEKLLSDPRWVGAINEKMVRVWRTRDTIPNQYLSKKYVELIKKGQNDLANQVKDPYYNEDFILKMPLSSEEKAEHDKLLKILENPKINIRALFKVAKVSYSIYQDAIREDEKKQVDMRAGHVLVIKKALQELRLILKKCVDKHQNRANWYERDKTELDIALNDDRIVLTIFMGHDLYASRASARNLKKMQLFEDAEASYIIERMLIFNLETQL